MIDNITRFTTHRCVSGKRVYKDIVERDVLGADEEVGPTGRVELGDTLNGHTGSVVSHKENGTVKGIVRVLNYLLAQVIPDSFHAHQNF